MILIALDNAILIAIRSDAAAKAGEAFDRAMYARSVGCHIEYRHWAARVDVYLDVVDACDNRF